MILAVDVDYRDAGAFIAGVAFRDWHDNEESGVFRSRLTGIREYTAGRFYLRELPCILKLIEEHRLVPETIVIDGFVWLDEKFRPGLGWHLYEALHRKTNVVGVAKSAFRGIPEEWKVVRGSSTKPLYVTSVGIPLESAKNCIVSMQGDNRMPNLLKRVDQECRRM